MINELSELQNKQVVIDVASQYIYLGKLVDVDAHYITLEEADVHDLRDANSTRELYVLEARRHGINVNRQQVHVRLEQVVSLSALDKVQV